MNFPFQYPESGRSLLGPRILSLERYRLCLHGGLLVTDAAITIAGMNVAGLIHRGEWLSSYSTLAAKLMVPIFLTIGLYNGVYSLASLNHFRTAARRVITALAVSAALLSFVVFFVKASDALSRFIYAFGLVFAFCGMLLLRYGLHLWLRRRFGPTMLNVLLIDAGGPKVSIPDAYRMDAEENGLFPSLEDPLGLDRLGQAMRNMDRVIVSCPPELEPDWALVFRAAAVDGEIVSPAAHRVGAVGVRHRFGQDFSTLMVSKGPLSLEARVIKRLFDLGLSIIALIILAPVLMAAAIAIKLEDGGPVFFLQKRVGRANRLFTIYKFRSMCMSRTDHDGHRSAERFDERVTRTGRVLRAWSIDELPQIWNILRGDMSIVGPRPHALGSLAGKKHFWEVDRRYWQRHALKPGLTGLAQIRGLRGATDAEEDLSSRLRADLEYLSGWSIMRDIGIVILTLRVIVHERAF